MLYVSTLFTRHCQEQCSSLEQLIFVICLARRAINFDKHVFFTYIPVNYAMKKYSEEFCKRVFPRFLLSYFMYVKPCAILD